MLFLRKLETLKLKLFGNSFLSYKVYRHFLKKYENTFCVDCHKALKKMVNLYVKLNSTCFHDLADAIELWIYHYGDNMILEYIQKKRNNELKILEDTITRSELLSLDVGVKQDM